MHTSVSDRRSLENSAKEHKGTQKGKNGYSVKTGVVEQRDGEGNATSIEVGISLLDLTDLENKCQMIYT